MNKLGVILKEGILSLDGIPIVEVHSDSRTGIAHTVNGLVIDGNIVKEKDTTGLGIYCVGGHVYYGKNALNGEYIPVPPTSNAGIVAISKDDYNALFMGESVSGYAPYNSNTIYNIVGDIGNTQSKFEGNNLVLEHKGVDYVTSIRKEQRAFGYMLNQIVINNYENPLYITLEGKPTGPQNVTLVPDDGLELSTTNVAFSQTKWDEWKQVNVIPKKSGLHKLVLKTAACDTVIDVLVADCHTLFKDGVWNEVNLESISGRCTIENEIKVLASGASTSGNYKTSTIKLDEQKVFVVYAVYKMSSGESNWLSKISIIDAETDEVISSKQLYNNVIANQIAEHGVYFMQVGTRIVPNGGERYVKIYHGMSGTGIVKELGYYVV